VSAYFYGGSKGEVTKEATIDLTAISSIDKLLEEINTKLDVKENNKENRELRIRIEGSGMSVVSLTLQYVRGKSSSDY
jgi:hypothetical protein